MKFRCAPTTLLIAAFAVLTANTAGAIPAPPGGKSIAPPELTVSVLDYTKMPTKDLERAESCATSIYRQAGIQLSWSNLKTDSYQLPPSHAYLMRIFRLSQLDKDYLGHGVAGFTWTNMPVSTMILDTIEDVAKRSEFRLSLILGCTIAHEIGHMLMPGRPHAEIGIMRSCLDRTAWEMAARGQLLFSDEESRLQRRRLRSLASAQPAPEAPTDFRHESEALALAGV